MIGSIHRTDAEPDALLWWSVRAQETAAKAAGDYGRKHRQQKTEETEIVTVLTHTYYRVKYLQERKEKPDFDEIRGGDREIYNLCFEGAQSNQPSSDPRPQKFFGRGGGDLPTLTISVGTDERQVDTSARLGYEPYRGPSAEWGHREVAARPSSHSTPESRRPSPGIVSEDEESV